MRDTTPRPNAGSLEGRVAGLRERAEPVGYGDRTRIDHVVTFQLVSGEERPDVVMRGEEFDGQLYEGDHVTIPVSARRRTGATINTALLVNLTRGGTYGLRQPKRRTPTLFWISSSLIVVPIAAIALVRLVSVWT